MSGRGRGRPSASVTVPALFAVAAVLTGVLGNLAASTVPQELLDRYSRWLWAGVVLFGGLAAARYWREQRAGDDAGAADLQADAADLAAAVRTDRQAFIDQALHFQSDRPPAANVTFANPAPQELPPHATELLVHWQDVDGAEAGDLGSIAGFYQDLESRRLVVLGAPGAGKTVLLSQLVLRMVAAREGGPVPVLISLTGFDPGDPAHADGVLRARFTDWIARELRESYQVPADQARRLVGSGLILPVLDGLDEMDPHAEDDATGARPKALAPSKSVGDVGLAVVQLPGGRG